MSNSRLPALVLVAGVLAALVLLAGSLSNLQLRPGAPFPGASDSGPLSIQPSPGRPAPEFLTLPLLQGMLAVAMVLLAALLVARLVALPNPKVILGLALAMLLLLTLGWILSQLAVDGAVSGLPDQTSAGSVPVTGYRVTPLGQPPDFLLPLVAVILGLGFVLLALTYAGGRMRRTRGRNLLQGDAERAVADLRQGRAVGGVVIRCYGNMCRSLQEARGIDRDRALTVEEFETQLVVRGFPENPIHQLTQLFEKARYGSEQMSDEDERLAMESLGEIVRLYGDARSGR